MFLQPLAPKFSLNYHSQNDFHIHSSSAVLFSSGFVQNPYFFLKQPLTSTAHKTPASVTCSSISQVHSYGTVDYEKRPMPNWNVIYKKISMMEDPNAGSASVLNQVENEGKTITKWELCRTVKELRKFRRYKFALQVYDWMNNRPERYRITTSDTAIQLDLIAKVHGIQSAEKYFLKLHDALKDKRIYGSLLNAYVRARMKEKAESLMDEIRDKGYIIHALPFNVMMTLYTNLKDHGKIELLVSEMKEKAIPLDIYSYNIWLSSCGALGDLMKMEQVFEKMQLDDTINPNWTTFSTMATMYIKSGHFEKAEACLKKIESRMTGRDRMPYHYLISHYGSIGKREEVYRVWNVYKAAFINIPNMGYHSMISSLIRLNDIDGAENMYDEWLSVKVQLDPRVGNLLLSSYVKAGLSQKVETFFDQMIQMGGIPNSMTWEILSENHIQNVRIPEALSCLKNAASAEGSMNWKPKPSNVSAILKHCDQEGDAAIKDALMEILNQVGCLDDVGYMSYASSLGISTSPTNNISAVTDTTDGDGDDEATYGLLNQLSESL